VRESEPGGSWKTVAEYRNDFLGGRNHDLVRRDCVRWATTAASQRNPLYAPDATPRQREGLKTLWWTELNRIKGKYTSTQTEDDYEEDIITLRHYINHCELANILIRSGDGSRDPGFRVSHAQKSLGVSLKWLWCIEDIPAPPQCPIDRRILKAAGYQGSSPWTAVNSLDDHRRLVAVLRTAATAKGCSLAEWEVGAWER
jgi:hypothetical protein